MKFNIGDKVCLLNEKGQGYISKILNKTTVYVEIEEGFNIPYPINELVLITPAETNTIANKPIDLEEKEPVFIKTENIAKLILEKEKGSRNKPLSKQHTKNSGVLEQEIDLHIELLMDNYKGMTNAQIINVQLNYFQNCLENAIYGNMQKIVFIHGVGNGRLKHEVRRILGTYQGISFYDASYKRYGFGATEVIIGNRK